jgi:hypothetical protein
MAETGGDVAQVTDHPAGNGRRYRPSTRNATDRTTSAVMERFRAGRKNVQWTS